MFPSLLRKEVQDQYVQENFVRIQDYFKASPLDRCEFKFFEILVPSAITDFPFLHRFNFTPKDVILLSMRPVATVTWNFDLFDERFVYLTTSARTTVRALIGRYA